MPDVTDWGRGGNEGFLRDPNNEQVGPLPANGVFTGQWTRVDNAASFLLLYGTNVSFKLIIQWSRDGVTLDTDPFATTSPQVRNRLGLYSVISGQSTFFRPFYRMKIINGPTPQLFAVSDALILKTLFDGYYIDVDGPIPVLGLAHLNANLSWGRTPTDWQPMQLTALKNQKIALAENLVGNLPVAVNGPVALDAATLAALESILVTLANEVALDPTTLSALEQIVVSGQVSLDAASLAALETVNVGNLPAVQPVTDIGSSYKHLNAPGTTLLKTGSGVLRRVVYNKWVATSTLTFYDGPVLPANVIAALSYSLAGSNFTPQVVQYDAKFTNGLTVVMTGLHDFTVVYD